MSGNIPPTPAPTPTFSSLFPTNSLSVREWAAASVSVLTLVLFAAALLIAYRSEDKNNLTLMIGAIIAWGGTAVNFWLGSSSSSQKKDDAIAAVAAMPSSVVNNNVTPT